MSQDQDVVQGWQCGVFVECTLYLLLMALGVLCIDTTVSDSINFLVIEYIDSALYSQIVGALLVVTACWQTILAIKARGRKVTMGFHAALGVGMSTVYILGIVYVGFYISTFVYLIAYATVVGGPLNRQWRRTCMFSGICVGALYAMFTLFKIYLPPTPLF